jgi:hypothetical protein
MNQQEFESNIDSMITDIVNYIKPECMKLFNLKQADANLALPNAIIYVVLSNLLIRYSPLNDQCAKLVKYFRPFANVN